MTMDTQGHDGEENLASEQLLVGKWVEGGGGGGAVFRLQGGSAPNQWKVCQRGAYNKIYQLMSGKFGII